MDNARREAGPRDMLNRSLKVGDICVYPVRRGSKMWMRKLTIQQISIEGDAFKIRGVKGDGYAVTITALDRLALIGRNNLIPFSE